MDSVAEWIAGCDVCHRIKHKKARLYGLLQVLLIPCDTGVVLSTGVQVVSKVIRLLSIIHNVIILDLVCGFRW